MQIKINDFNGVDITKYFDETYEFIEENLKNSNVLVHCQAGISRSPTIIIAYLMKKNKMTFLEALNHVFALRNEINPNNGFRE